jgi:biopolymer transport protein ExbB/biopolymer transport protein TolQ
MNFDLVQVAQIVAKVVLYVLLALSVLSAGVILDRWWYFFRRKADIDALGSRMLQLLKAGDRAAAQAYLAQSRSVEAEVLREALDWYDQGPESFEQILVKAVRRRRRFFEQGLLFLGTLGNNAPFIGLFGTVLGIVTAFHGLGSNQAGAMGNVMSSIAEALIATAIGILVALPAVVSYNVFQKKGADIEENSAALGNLVLALLKSRGEAPSHGHLGLARESGMPEVTPHRAKEVEA